jgi:hypothetical protein
MNFIGWLFVGKGFFRKSEESDYLVDDGIRITRPL